MKNRNTVLDCLYLFNQSDDHRLYTLVEFNHYCLFPLIHKKAHLFYENDKSIGFVSWAWITEEEAEEFLSEMWMPSEEVLNEETMEMEDVMHEVITVTAIEPLEPTVTRLVYSEDDPMAEPTEETIENPLITTDNAERAAAQAVVDATPQAVVDAA